MSSPNHITALRNGLKPGFNQLLDRRRDAEVGLDFGVELLRAGETREFSDAAVELALLVIEGKGTLAAGQQTLPFSRQEWRTQGPPIAHGPAGTKFEVHATTECHVALIAAENRKTFPVRLYRPNDVPMEHRGQGMLNDTAYRLVRCAFDRQSAPPEAELVLGEVITFPGKWSSYPPHHHKQPEIYYYRFWPEQGYGHGELGESVYSLRQHDLLRITAGRDHAQVAAPGYYMYYLWAIRHLPNSPYTGFEYNPDHRWLVESK